MPREPTDIVEPKLRIRESLRAKLEAEATRQQTSLNAEMVRRLEDSFDDKPRANLARPRKILRRAPRTSVRSPRE